MLEEAEPRSVTVSFIFMKIVKVILCNLAEVRMAFLKEHSAPAKLLWEK